MKMKKEDISEKIVSILIEMGFEPPKKYDDIDFKNELELNNLNYAELYLEIEKEYDLNIKYEKNVVHEIFKINTLKKAVDYVYDKLQEKSTI